MTAARLDAGVRAWLAGVTARPWTVVFTGLALAALALYYTATVLEVDTRTEALLDPDLPFQQAQTRYAEAFPSYHDTLIAVVEAPTPEQADAAAGQVAATLAADADTFPVVYRPRGGPFLDEYGLLYRPVDHLQSLADRLAQAQPLLARLQRDPSLVGLFDTLRLAESRNTEALAPIRPRIRAVLEASRRGGDPDPIAWESALGPEAEVGTPRSLVVARPDLDFSRVTPGASALAAARGHLAALELEDGVRVRLTGPVPLRVEELRSALAGAQLAGTIALVLVTVVLLWALRSVGHVLITLAVLAVGLALSAGMATLLVGRINLISMAFAVLYIGLGVNYAIHYLLRFREALAEGWARRAAIQVAGRRLRGPLFLCTATTALGFFAFLPTAYAGVAELGLIAGTALFITLGVTYSVLPALLQLVPPPRRPTVGLSAPGRVVRDWPHRNPRTVQLVALGLAIGSVAVASQARFDADPLNLRDPGSESVATMRDLLADERLGQRSLVTLVEQPTERTRLAEELEALETVARVITLEDWIPADQAEKQAILADIAFLLGPDLRHRGITLESPSVEAARAAAESLADALDPGGSGLRAALIDWTRHLEGLSPAAAQASVARVQQALLGTLPLAFDRLRRGLEPGAVEAEDLPPGLRARFVNPDTGTSLLRIQPAGDMTDPQARTRFVAEVRGVTPNVAGGLVQQLEAGRTIAQSFRTALLGAAIGIAAVLLLLLRDIVWVVRLLMPLVLGGLLTVATLVLLGIPFNFANVIALPLLLGVGVDNGVHMGLRLREGARTEAVLHGTTVRALLFGSLTTVVSFGNLALSPHQGTASLGIALGMGMVWILLTTVTLLPALVAGHAGGRRA